MEILYWAFGVVTGVMGALLYNTYNLYREYRQALRFSENCSYLLQMKSCCVKSSANGEYVVAELDGVQLSRKRMKNFEFFVLHLMNDNDRGPLITSKGGYTGSNEPFVPQFNTEKLREWLRAASNTIWPLVSKHCCLNFVSKLLLRRKYEQLSEQYEKVNSQLYELNSIKDTFVCFF